ncbi:hypothetical protein ACFSJW_02230 [Flavobacterium artemisiae]|uniref:Uncharacterized protein n=1 Tax=Flavobacterium artemisiae TaxID=2126556 RepID=A0ABW4HJ71_9FLAO
MSRENYDNYDQEDLTYHAADHSASDSINSETMEKKILLLTSMKTSHKDTNTRQNIWKEKMRIMTPQILSFKKMLL